MNALLFCLASFLSVGSQEDESTILRAEHKGAPTLNGTYIVSNYFRAGTRILEVREYDDIGQASAEVFDVDGRKVFSVSSRRDHYFRIDKVDGVLIREIDLDSDGKDDLVAVEIDKDRMDYFQIVDLGKMEPVSSELLAKAKQRVSESPSIEEIDAICELIREGAEDN